MTSIMVKYKLL